ncbi:PHA/PHB synthase family protein [Pleionea sediminis]|uniref:PHA/PHB synthase family protein n=1 Tax=Pleionea sediminis TaxID=2569479 RepID=UPI001186DBA7|nr:class I poly(R)-hydroxyalkanoic acid synthase [Pleionea sediminis]
MSSNNNQEEFFSSIEQLGQQMIEAGELMQKNAQRLWFDMQRQTLMNQEIGEALALLMQQPDRLQAFQKAMIEALASINSPSEGKERDRRFNDDAWQKPGFKELKDIYLQFSEATMSLFSDILPHDEDKSQRILFYVRQWLSAIAPSNYLMTNPVALLETQKTGGMNLVKGLHNYLEDMKRGKGLQNIRMTDLNAFKPGENLAITDGKVIYQNDLMQLIQYTPTTDKVSEKPLLIVPPWINKYYILDLKQENSLVKWAVDQGQTVFMISWVNPDKSHADMGFEEYVKLGVIEALDAVEQQTGQSSINTLGYCLGGTLLGTSLALLKSKNDKRVNSATFLTTLLDFEYPGELGCFLSQEQLDILDQQMESEGILDGRALAMAYNMLRENDLHWSYHVNNYLLGKEPPAFDLLYWNSDATNLPAAMHSFYLKNMYLENKLKDPGGISIDGVEIDLRKIDIPCYFLSAQKDHIALWKSTFLGAQILSGKNEFVLAGSGHVAGVINPANSGKYSYFINSDTKKPAEEWLETAEQKEGSWWPHWMNWLTELGGSKIAARDNENGKLKAIEDAPGSFVLKTLD